MPRVQANANAGRELISGTFVIMEGKYENYPFRLSTEEETNLVNSGVFAAELGIRKLEFIPTGMTDYPEEYEITVYLQDGTLILKRFSSDGYTLNIDPALKPITKFHVRNWYIQDVVKKGEDFIVVNYSNF